MKIRHGTLSDILARNDFSDFDKKVYKAISRIPPGQVRSYGWVAKAIGRPNSCRAVGNALNRNPYPVTIPCHRVIKSDSSLGGYAKGAGIKKRLLRREGILLRRSRVNLRHGFAGTGPTKLSHS